MKQRCICQRSDAEDSRRPTGRDDELMHSLRVLGVARGLLNLRTRSHT
jgi:hypothetical protein